jgi:hypothetical protein
VTGLWRGTAASINFQLGDRSLWRKPAILTDAVLAIIAAGDGTSPLTGQQLIDDTFLRSQGWTDDDLKRYRCDPDVEPPRLLDTDLDEQLGRTMMRRGDVAKVARDVQGSAGALSAALKSKL